jgi:hypothetical protein
VKVISIRREGLLGSDSIQAHSLKEMAGTGRRTLHFWVSTFPFFDCVLMLVPARAAVPIAPAAVTIAPNLPEKVGERGEWSIELKIFDADGGLANEVEYKFSDEKVVFLELDSLLGSTKLESGLKHAHLQASVPEGCGANVRLFHKEGACLMGPTIPVRPQHSGFLPVTFSQERSNLLCAVNTGSGEVVAKLRLFCGKRNPETALHIPPRGARVINLELEFQDYTQDPGNLRVDEPTQGYVRVTLKHGDSVGVQVLEQIQTAKESVLFSALS